MLRIHERLEFTETLMLATARSRRIPSVAGGRDVGGDALLDEVRLGGAPIDGVTQAAINDASGDSPCCSPTECVASW